MNDFTLNNPIIRNYFEGKTDTPPVGELVYLHSHPLVIPNFLTQIEERFLEAGKAMAKRNLKGKVLEDVMQIGIKIGQTLPNLTYETAPIIIEELRKLYRLSNEIIGTLE